MTTAPAIRTTTLPSGEQIPVLGQGTWHLAEDPSRRADEIAALRLGLDLGMTLIDTAEMFGDGAAEELVREAITGRRDEVFLVTKVLPANATGRGMAAACEASLRRLGTDRIDLYLLHWRGEVPLAETVEAFDDLVRAGEIRHWGVSNFDIGDLTELLAADRGGAAVTDQVLYNLTRRGIEWDLLPGCQELGMPVMAYAPMEQGRMLGDPVLRAIAADHDASPAQIALAWLLHHDHVSTTPRAGNPEHVRENRGALDIRLSQEDLTALERAFPPPTGRIPLEVL